MNRTYLVLLTAILLLGPWSIGGERQVEGDEAREPIPPGKAGPNKLPPLPKGAELVEVVGEVEWPRSDGPNREFKPVSRQPPTLVARAKEELMQTWVADGGSKERAPRFVPADAKDDASRAREVNFAREMVIGVFWRGVTDRNTINIERISRQGDKVIVEFRRHTLQRGGAVPRPRHAAHVVVVSRKTENVEFRELPISITVDKRVIP